MDEKDLALPPVAPAKQQVVTPVENAPAKVKEPKGDLFSPNETNNEVGTGEDAGI
jgi:hypothetical protein